MDLVQKILILALIGCVIYIVIVFFRTRRDDDGARIAEYLQRQGCQLLSLKMVPIAVQWGMDKYTRIYDVTYRKSDGRQLTGRFRTSSLHGVEPLDD
jgi:hypothetical protein